MTSNTYKEITLSNVPFSGNSNIYVIGEDHSKIFNNIEKYDVKRNKWTIKLLMPTARHGLATVFIDDDNIKYI
jgi:hypothetical protein